jgi:hypothetical protein
MPDDRRDRAPVTGSASARDTEMSSEEEPVVIGALFLCIVMLILIGGAWVVMFNTLTER